MSKSKSTGKSKEVFEGLRIAIDGKFGENWPKDRIKRFIVNNGGEVIEYKDNEMTHLICTIKAFSEKTFAVQEALRRSKKQKKHGVKLVTIDWLEESLMSRRQKREEDYSVAEAALEKAKRKKQRARKRKEAVDNDMTNFAMAVSDAKATYNIEGYNLYQDPTGFRYDIELKPADEDRAKTTEHLVMRLYESHEPPHAYGAYATYTDALLNKSRQILAPIGSEFSVAFEAFKQEFKDRTHREWRDRAEAHIAVLQDGTKDFSAFVYKQPIHGPLGMDLPPGHNHAHEPDQDEEAEASDASAAKHHDHGNTSTEVKGQDTDDDQGFETADEGHLGGEMYLLPNDTSMLGLQQFQTEAPVGFTPVNAQQTSQTQQMSRSRHLAPEASQAYGDANGENDVAARQSRYNPMMTPTLASGPMNAHEFVYGVQNAPEDSNDVKPGIVTWNWGGRVGYMDDVL